MEVQQHGNFYEDLKTRQITGLDKKSYDFNYDRIFRKASKDKKEIKSYNTELESCRAKSKTFSMDQE